MEIYNKEFVYFDWDDKLEGKKVFFSDSINDLKENVKDNRPMWYGEICHNVNTGTNFPFGFIDDSGSSHCFRFCYYDPHYEVKRAFMESKKIEMEIDGKWFPATKPTWNPDTEYRIEPGWYITIDEYGLSRTNSKEGEKCVVFEGTEDECIKWMDEHKKFEKTMIAWINGAQIELGLQDPICGIKWTSAIKPTWDPSYCYRVKPNIESEYVPFDSIQELIDAWDEKYPQNKNRPKGTMPLIWIKDKECNRVHLITDFFFERVYMEYDVSTSDYHFTLKELFESYTFADGSIIGKVKEE